MVKRPAPETKMLFRGVHGRLELDLYGRDKSQAGAVVPTFYSLAGEEVNIPKQFQEAFRGVTKAVNCVGCSHLSLCQGTRGASSGVRTRQISEPRSRERIVMSGRGVKGREGNMHEKLKHYALVICLF